MTTQTVEQAKTIDVGWCNDRGLFQDGVSGVITWTRERDGKEVASVGHAFVDDGSTDALVLFYTITPNRGDEDPRAVSYPIRIEYTECNFGGARPWFRCPVCHRRVGKLYKTPKHDEYACRDCGGFSTSHRLIGSRSARRSIGSTRRAGVSNRASLPTMR